MIEDFLGYCQTSIFFYIVCTKHNIFEFSFITKIPIVIITIGILVTIITQNVNAYCPSAIFGASHFSAFSNGISLRFAKSST